jgi:UDP-N-acetylmuramoyl-tripeptide--D-alanyl-D-alanine ligase
MGELGSSGGQLHQAIGKFAKSKHIQKVYALGDLSRQTVVGFGSGAQHFSSHADLLSALLQDLSAEQDSSVHILVKGSRSMSMEQIVVGLLATDEQSLSDTWENRC